MDLNEPNESLEEAGWTRGMSIADQVKAAAEEAVNQTGFVYDENTGLYYDSGTQLYYNPETGLYYNGYTGTWYQYDEVSMEYKVHHQVEGFTFENAVAEHVLNSIENYTNELSKKVEAEIKPDKEEGELSEEEESEESAENSRQRENKSEAQLRAERLPPCIRFLVVDSNIQQVPVGSLFVVPYTGGMIGRLSTCEVYLDDVNVSKQHAKFGYNDDEKAFTIIDQGSRNGTYIHSERLSASKEVSEEYILAHDSRLQVGGITLICHVHAGLETCDGCEPGLVAQHATVQDSEASTASQTRKIDLEQARKRELRKIRQKFGLKLHDPDSEQPPLPSGYEDRAETRRQKVGIDPLGAKTEQASVQVPIAKKNKGFQMLAKMGWKEGQSLGNSETADAITEPISVEVRSGREGLGSATALLPDPSSFHSDASRKRRADVLEKTRQRYSQTQ